MSAGDNEMIILDALYGWYMLQKAEMCMVGNLRFLLLFCSCRAELPAKRILGKYQC